MDTETTPATGTRIAERMITRNEAAFLIGAVHSGVANAISQVAQKYGCVYLNTNSSSPTEAGKDCHRVKFVWDGNGTQLLARDRQERDERQRQELAAADQRLRLGPHDLEGDARDHRGQRRQGRRRAAGAAEHARLRVLPAEDPADQARRRRHRGRRRRHQGAAPAGRAVEDEQEAGLDQQPAGLARRLRPRAGGDLRRVRHQLVLPARPARRQGVRRRLPEAVPGHRHQDAGQRLLQRLHGDARAAAGGRARRHDQQPEGDPGAREPEGHARATACSTSTPT